MEEDFDPMTEHFDPANLTAEVEGDAIRITCDESPSDVSEYRWFRRTPPTGAVFDPNTDTAIAVTSGASHLDTSVVEGQEYEFQAFGKITTEAEPVDPDPGQVQNLHYTARTESSITVAWDEIVHENLYDYHLQCFVDGSWTTIMFEEPLSVRSFEHTGLDEDTSYDYRVRARTRLSSEDPIENGAWSDTLTVSTLSSIATDPDPGQVQNLHHTNRTDTSITVAWDAVSHEDLYDYQLQYLVDSTWTTIMFEESTSVRSFKHTGLAPETSYSYRVRARTRLSSEDPIENGAWSDTLTVSTLAEDAPITALLINNFEGISDSTTLTTSNSANGGDAFDVVNSGDTLEVQVSGGHSSLRIRNRALEGGGTLNTYAAWTTAWSNNAQAYVMWDLRVNDRPGSTTRLANLMVDGSSILAGVNMRSSGAVSLISITNATVWTGPVIPLGERALVSVHVNIDTDTLEMRVQFGETDETSTPLAVTMTGEVTSIRTPMHSDSDSLDLSLFAIAADPTDWPSGGGGSGGGALEEPTATYTYTPSTIDTDTEVSFDGTGSTAVSPATLTSYAWHDVTNDVALGTGSTINHTFSTSGTRTVRLTVTDSEGLTDTYSESIEVSAVSGGGGGGDPDAFMFGFTEADILALPTSGSAWNNLVSKSDQTLTVDMGGSIASSVANSAFACGLRYVRTGDTTYRDKVVTAIEEVVGASSYDYQTAFRQIYGWAMAAELVGYKPSHVMNFFDDIRYLQLANLARWQSIWHGAWDCSNNHGTLARASYTACCLFIGDMSSTSPSNAVGPSSGQSQPAGFEQAVKFLRGFIGNRSVYTTRPSGTVSFGGYSMVGSSSSHERIITWTDLGDSNWKCLAPASDRDQKNGGVINDISRSSGSTTHAAYSETGGEPDWESVGIMYQFTGAQGFMADAVMVAANWDTSIWSEEDNALHRWRSLIARYNADHTHPGLTGWLDPMVNAIYGTSYPHAAEGGYGFGFTDWLYG